MDLKEGETKVVVYRGGHGRPQHSDASGHIFRKIGKIIVATPLYPIRLLRRNGGKGSYEKVTATLGKQKGLD